MLKVLRVYALPMKKLLCILLLSATSFGQTPDAQRHAEKEKDECRAESWKSPFPGVLLAPSGDQRIVGNYSLIFDGGEFRVESSEAFGSVLMSVQTRFAAKDSLWGCFMPVTSSFTWVPPTSLTPEFADSPSFHPLVANPINKVSHYCDIDQKHGDLDRSRIAVDLVKFNRNQ